MHKPVDFDIFKQSLSSQFLYNHWSSSVKTSPPKLCLQPTYFEKPRNPVFELQQSLSPIVFKKPFDAHQLYPPFINPPVARIIDRKKAKSMSLASLRTKEFKPTLPGSSAPIKLTSTRRKRQSIPIPQSAPTCRYSLYPKLPLIKSRLTINRPGNIPEKPSWLKLVPDNSLTKGINCVGLHQDGELAENTNESNEIIGSEITGNMKLTPDSLLTNVIDRELAEYLHESNPIIQNDAPAMCSSLSDLSVALNNTPLPVQPLVPTTIGHKEDSSTRRGYISIYATRSYRRKAEQVLVSCIGADSSLFGISKRSALLTDDTVEAHRPLDESCVPKLVPDPWSASSTIFFL